MKKYLTFLFFICMTTFVQGQNSWSIDPTNSSIQFKVGHLMISSVPGRFNNFKAEITTSKENEFEKSQLDANIKVKSIDTGNRQRDNHLLQSDFFETDSFPEITFANAVLEFSDAKNFQVAGDLTIKGITKQIEFKGTFGGHARMFGQDRAGFTATGKLNRFDYNIRFDEKLDNGVLMVGKEVEFILNLEFVKQD